MYVFKEITNPEEWESFVLSQTYTFFVQSATYGDFYQDLGEKSWIFGIYQDNKLVGGSLVVSTHARRGNFLYLPYGPIMDFTDEQLLPQFAGWLHNFAKQNKYDFIRLSPFATDSEKIKDIFHRAGFRPAPMHVLAETSWVLDLTPSEEILLAQMNKTHRYLIRRCQKEGVKIVTTTKVEDLIKFNQMHDTTAQRHNFHRFSADYITKEFINFSQKGKSLLYQAHLPDGSIDAEAIIMFYGNMAAYRHSASLGLNNKLPTSYLLQWEVIREAKRRGMKWYNFWGIAPDGARKSHPYFGITHFKKGFGGKQLDILHCHDLPVTAKYWFNWTIESIRRWRRKF